MDEKNKKKAIFAVIGEICSNAKAYRMSSYIDRYGIRFHFYWDDRGMAFPTTLEYDGKHYHAMSDESMSRLVELCGDKIPDYDRGVDFQALIDDIKAKARKVSDWVRYGSNSGLLGVNLRSHGCFVAYNGYGCCDFEYGGVWFHAMSDGGGRRWELTDRIEVIREDGTMSEDFRLSRINEVAEAFLWGMTRTGKRMTEKDKIKGYKDFYVCSDGPRETEYVGHFSSFEEANKYAFEYAKEKAGSLPRDLQKYSYRSPRDISDEIDECGAWLWYSYDGMRYYIYVKGE